MRVLVCDDDVDVGNFLNTLFGLEGWSSDLVTSGEACLAHLDAAEAPDVLVLDQVMPGMVGTAVADKLRSSGFEVPIILCSGHLGPELNAEIDRLGLIPVSKIDLAALVRIVQEAVRSAPKARTATKKAPAKKAATKKAPAKKAVRKAPSKRAPLGRTAPPK
jgi:CheY-like chemotaxis protein